MPKVPPLSAPMSRTLGAAWLAAFLFLVTCFGSVEPLAPGTFAGLAAAGLLYCAAFQRQRLVFLLATQRLLLGSAVVAVLALLAAGGALAWTRPAQFQMPLPAQVGLLLCIAPLAVILSDPWRLKATITVFALICVVHLFALPFDAVTGQPVFYQLGEPLFPRDFGPLHYQARGMAWQVYYFPGLFLPMFYLAAGGIGEERLFGRRTFSARSWLVASLAWCAAVACLQSRSALAGTLAACIVGWLAFAQVRRARAWAIAAVVTLMGAAAYWLLFSENKSGGNLRWAYLLLYLRDSFDAGWLWTGRGYTIFADERMQVPGMQFVVHSHNDFVQTFYTWGLAALVAYLLFWLALLRLAWQFLRAGRYWPALALIAAGPSFMTDLGLHNLEKTAFLAILAALLATLATSRLSTEPRAGSREERPFAIR